MSRLIFDKLYKRNVEIKEDVLLSELSSVKIGGRARAIVFPKNREELLLSVSVLRKNGISFKTVGRMTNLLPPDEGYGAVIIKTDKMNAFSFEGEKLFAECGAFLPALANFALKKSLSGLEELSGIPSSIGGAVYGNAGAFGKETSDILLSAELLDTDSLEVLEVPASGLGLGYRSSALKKGRFILLSAEFGLKNGGREEIFEKMRVCREKRKATQPSLPSLGSTFKRTAGVSAAGLIDKCGLKGFRLGGAAVSEKHAGFIVNVGGASSEDYRALASLVAKQVYEKFGVTLEREVEYL